MQVEYDLLKTNKAYSKIAKALTKPDNFPHAVLLLGSDSEALSMFAKFIAKSLMCEGKGSGICEQCSNCLKVENNTHADVLVYPKTERGFLVDDAMEVTDTMHTLAYEGGKKIYILNLGSSPNAQSQNKLLKSLEEPARDVVFILTSTNEAGVLATIKSRTNKFNIHNFGIVELEHFLQKKFANNDTKIAASYSGGSLADAQKNVTDKNFERRLDLVFNLLIKMTHSSNCLRFTELVQKEKSDMKSFIRLFGIVVGFGLQMACGQEAKVMGNEEEYSLIVKNFGKMGLSKLIKLVGEVNERVLRNANFLATIDYFILKILEVRFNANNNSIR